MDKKELEKMDETFNEIISNHQKATLEIKLAKMSDSEMEAYLYGNWNDKKED